MQDPKSGTDVEAVKQAKVLLCGAVGVGKSTQLMTLPGKKIIYVFDPNALEAYIKADDWDYFTFIPGPTELDIAVRTLHTTDKSEKHDTTGRASGRKAEPVAYPKFEADFETRCENGWFLDNGYDWIIFDSNTTLQDIIMDRVQYLNGRLGKQPEEADWGAVMTTQRSIFRAAIGTGLNFCCTAHVEPYKDDFTGRVTQRIMTIGRNRIRIPLLFSQTYLLENDIVQGKPSYGIHTIGSKTFPFCRTNIRGLDPLENVTIDNLRNMQGKGLGRFVIP